MEKVSLFTLLVESFYRIGCYTNQFKVKTEGDYKDKDMIQFICYLGPILSQDGAWWTSEEENATNFIPCSECKTGNCFTEPFAPQPDNTQTSYTPKATCGKCLHGIYNIYNFISISQNCMKQAYRH